MATEPTPTGLSDDEVTRLLDENPALRATLEEEESAIISGDCVALPHDEAMPTLGLDRAPAGRPMGPPGTVG
jgi:hypothetical protein